MTQDTKSRKPTNTAFKQQRLPAWQPILTPKTVLPTFFIIGLVFAPIGGLLLYASNEVNEIIINYTTCGSQSVTFTSIPSWYFSSSFSTYDDSHPRWMAYPTTTFLDGTNPNNISITRCIIEFALPVQLQAPVFLYYRLTNFYQNHRRYVKSFNSDQLKGSVVSASAVDSSCSPLGSTDGIPYYPCGLIANSMFNDTISNFTVTMPSTSINLTYVFESKGIAWPTDKAKYGHTAYNSSQALPPPNWALRYPDGRFTDSYPPPDLSIDEHFMVWMRTAGLPNFRKLWGRQDKIDMPPGWYHVEIDMNFNTTKYEGTKAMVISTTSALGGRNPFLGVAYLVVGCLCVFFGIVFTARHLIKPRKLGDESYLSWNQPVSQGHRD